MQTWLWHGCLSLSRCAMQPESPAVIRWDVESMRPLRLHPSVAHRTVRGRAAALDGRAATVTIAIPGLGWCSQCTLHREELPLLQSPDSRLQVPEPRFSGMLQKPQDAGLHSGPHVESASPPPCRAPCESMRKVTLIRCVVCRQDATSRLVKRAGWRARGRSQVDKTALGRRHEEEHQSIGELLLLSKKHTQKIGWAVWARAGVRRDR